ncbi:MAG: DUF1385 domain-containing protein [Eggerthellaceae bacterium]|nr:DUF1385 domain-containing protein [Eggerthellaceae bacterium]
MGDKEAPKKSDFTRAFAEDGTRKTHVGGQALLEGIMMRGKYNWSVAVRQPDGTIYLEEHDLTSGKDSHKWMKWPFIRGCTALVESMGIGFKALQIAAEHAFGDEEGEERQEAEGQELIEMMEETLNPQDEDAHAYEVTGCAADGTGEPQVKEVPYKEEPSKGSAGKPSEPSEDEGLGKGVMAASMVAGVILALVLFMIVPAALTNLIVGEYDQNTIMWNVVDGIIRVAIFIFYIWLIGRMEDIRRMFQYHGAEHKAIHCFEHCLPMTAENARSFPRLHVRCGTAFLIMVLVLAIIIYTVIPINSIIDATSVPDGLPKLLLVIVVRILFLPVIAGISYEITVKWAGSHPDNPIVKVILWPGMQMQYLTTNEPDDEHIECAIAAMKMVLEREEREEALEAGSH